MSDSDTGQSVDSSRRKMLALLGGSASAGLAGCSAIFGDGGGNGNGNGNGDGTPGGNGNGDGTDTATPESERTEADKAQAAWERIAENPGPDSEELRAEAHVEIEQAVRDSGIVLPMFHETTEWFWYDGVDAPEMGSLGESHVQYHNTTVEDDSELNLIMDPFSQLDPVESDTVYSSAAIAQMYEKFVEYPNGVAELSNMLLDEFEVSDDGLNYTFHLKEGVTFHNGDEMTASDVKYSFRRVVEAPNAVRASFLLSPSDGIGVVHETNEDGNVVPDSIAVEVVDDYTLEMEIQQPNPQTMDILTYTAFSVMPEGLVGDIEGYDGEVDKEELRQGTAAIGTGPFEIDTFTLNEEVAFTRFDDYHRDTAEVESLHFALISDDEPRYTYAMERNADIFTIPTAYYDQELVEVEEEDDRGRSFGTYGPHENDETTSYMRVPQLSISYMAFNAQEVPKPVRQAFAYVYNHEEVVTDVYAGRVAPAFSFTPPGIWPTGTDGYQEFVDNYPYSRNETDIEGAQQVLEEAGYTPDDPFEMTLTTSTGGTAVQTAELQQEKLAGNGVEVDLDQAQFPTLVERGENGNLQAYTLGWAWSWESPAYGHFGFEPENTNTDRIPEEANGYYLNWHVELEEEA